MSRELRPIDPADSPEAAFAAELRKLYERAGKPKFLQMARKTGKSRTALSEAVGGDHLPAWETVAAFVTACDDKPAEWRVRWEETRELRASSTKYFNHPESELAPNAAMTASANTMMRYLLRRDMPNGWVAVLSAALIAMTLFKVGYGSRQPAPQPIVSASSNSRALIIVQNKVALGTNELLEDATPAYLSTEPSPFCASRKCKVDGTDFASGAALVAVCHIHGTEMFNYNLDSPESKENPHRARSTLWYKVTFPNGLAGFISEVYIDPDDRGGVGLPACRAATNPTNAP